MQLVNIPSAFMTFVHKLSLSSSISKLLNNETFFEELELFKAGAYLNDGLKVLQSSVNRLVNNFEIKKLFRVKILDVATF